MSKPRKWPRYWLIEGKFVYRAKRLSDFGEGWFHIPQQWKRTKGAMGPLIKDAAQNGWPEITRAEARRRGARV